MMLGPIARAIAIASGGLAVLFAVMSGRALFEARAEAARASSSLAAGDVDLAIVRLRSSARWAAPFNVYAEESLVRLEAIAQAARQRGDAGRELAALRAVHAAIHATRSFYLPHEDRLARADERIAALMAEQPVPPIDRAKSQEQRKADYLRLLAPGGPRPFGVLLALVGFATWVGSAVVFLLWGVDAEGRVLRPLGRRSAFFLLFGWIAFAVGLRLA